MKTMKRGRNNYHIGYIAFVLCFFAALIWAHAQNKRRSCLAIEVHISPENLHFLPASQLRVWVDAHAQRPILGQPSGKLALNEIRERLLAHDFISDAKIKRTHDGNLHVYVKQIHPLARVMAFDEFQGYLTEDGLFVPLSDNFTPYVPILALHTKKEVPNNWAEAAAFVPLLKFMQRIKKSTFFNAQIAYIEQFSDEQLRLYGQIGNETIYFGPLENVEEKFSKLYMVYTQILPTKGWGKYSVIDLRFNNQIVCK